MELCTKVKKLPKLVATEADKRILMLERDQWHVDHAAIAAELECLRDDFPKLALVDEIWIAETHHNRHLVFFDPVRPDRSYAPVSLDIADVETAVEPRAVRSLIDLDPARNVMHSDAIRCLLTQNNSRHESISTTSEPERAADYRQPIRAKSCRTHWASGKA